MVQDLWRYHGVTFNRLATGKGGLRDRIHDNLQHDFKSGCSVTFIIMKISRGNRGIDSAFIQAIWTLSNPVWTSFRSQAAKKHQESMTFPRPLCDNTTTFLGVLSHETSSIDLCLAIEVIYSVSIDFGVVILASVYFLMLGCKQPPRIEDFPAPISDNTTSLLGVLSHGIGSM